MSDPARTLIKDGKLQGDLDCDHYHLLNITLDISDLNVQPLDSDLTAIAALGTQPFGRVLLTKADAAAVRTYLGVGTSTFDGNFTSLNMSGSTLASLVSKNFSDLTIDTNIPASFLGTSATTAAAGNDSRLSDTRTPTDASVTNAKVAVGAAIAWSKISKSLSNLTDLATRNFSSLQNIPQTIAGYGIEDAVHNVGTESISGAKTFNTGPTIADSSASTIGFIDSNKKLISLATPTQRGLAKHIWISARTDSLPGTGTPENPFDGSTQAKFDAILLYYYTTVPTTNLHVHLGVGTFQTLVSPANLWLPLDGWTIEGQGAELTTLQATGDLAGVNYDVEVIKSDSSNPPGGVTIKHLCVDGNFPTLGLTMDEGAGSRTIASTLTSNGSPIIRSVNGAFKLKDLYRTISGTGIPDGNTTVRIPKTNIASGSNGVQMTGTYVINVASGQTNDFTSAGSLLVESTTGRFNAVAYTGKSSTQFTGCTGGSGYMRTGGVITTDTQIVMSANATANGTVTVTLGGERNGSILPINLSSSGDCVCEDVLVKGGYGSISNGAEAFFIRIGIGTASTSSNNHILKCQARDNYGSYGNAFCLFGSDSTHPMTDSSIENCTAIGESDGWNSSGLSNSAINSTYLKNCKITGNYASDCARLYYCEWDLDGVEISNNQGVRVGNAGIMIYLSANKNANRVRITNNQLLVTATSNSANETNGIWLLANDTGSTATDFVVSDNLISYQSDGRGSDSSGFAFVGFGIVGLTLTNNTFNIGASSLDYDVRNDSNVTDFTNTYLKGNRLTTGALIAKLPDTAQEAQATLVAVGSPVSLSDGTGANVATLSLTAGSWDVSGNVNFSEGSATVTARSAGVTVTTATVPTDGTECYLGTQTTTTTEKNSIIIPKKRVTITTTANVYLVAKVSFSAGTIGAFGSISATRVQ